MTDHWQWPQFLLAFWWVFVLFTRLVLRAAGVTMPGQPPKTTKEWTSGTINQVINIVVLATILYFGGFWS